MKQDVRVNQLISAKLSPVAKVATIKGCEVKSTSVCAFVGRVLYSLNENKITNKNVKMKLTLAEDK